MTGRRLNCCPVNDAVTRTSGHWSIRRTFTAAAHPFFFSAWCVFPYAQPTWTRSIPLQHPYVMVLHLTKCNRSELGSFKTMRSSYYFTWAIFGGFFQIRLAWTQIKIQIHVGYCWYTHKIRIDQNPPVGIISMVDLLFLLAEISYYFLIFFS
jgi:hypothetical protein